MTTDLVPLVTVAAETGVDVNALAQQLADAVAFDAAGLRCIPSARSNEFIEELKARRAAEQERDRRWLATQIASDPMNQVHAQVKAIADHQQQLREAGMLDADLPAVACMTAADYEAAMATKAGHLDEMM